MAKTLHVEEDRDKLLAGLLKIKAMLKKYRRWDKAGVDQDRLREINRDTLKGVTKLMPCDEDSYYAITRDGHTRNCWIGKCTGEGIPGVLAEEPGVEFVRISKKDFHEEMD